MHVTSQATTVYESVSVKFLPIIDLNPSDQTCIHSTLLFVIEEAKKLNITSLCNYVWSTTLAKGNGDNQGKKSTNGMLVRRIPNINELSWKYRESHEWFRFGESLWRSLFWRYNWAYFIRTRSSNSPNGTYTGPESFSQLNQQHINRWRKS